MKMGIEDVCGKHKCSENNASPPGEVCSLYSLCFTSRGFEGESSLSEA
jgi:hypothetical protein